MGKGGIDVELPNPWTLNINPNVTLDVIDSIDTNTNAAVAMSIPEIDTIDANLSMSIPEIDTIDANLSMSIPEIDTIDANLTTHVSADMSVDVKPVVLDLCLTLGVKDLPNVCISRPYDRSFNVTVFGMEVFGFRRRGERKIIIDDLPKRPFVAVGGEAHQTRQRHAPKIVGDPTDTGLRISVG